MKARRLIPLLAAALGAALLAIGPARAQLQKPFIWELSKGGQTHTLFGSLHIGKPDFYPLPAAVTTRFNAARVVALEADLSQPEAGAACVRLAQSDAPYDSALNNNQKRLLANYIRLANVDPTQLEGRKLWMVNLVLVMSEMTQLGVDFDSGLDLNLLQQAQRDQKRIVEIEGSERQCTNLAAAPDAESAAALGRFLDTVRNNRMASRIENMISAYRAGDGDTLLRGIYEEYGSEPLGIQARQRVFDQRHPHMAQVIDGYFSRQAQPHFIVVGVGHLLGDNNLLDALEKRGIKARRLQ